MFDDIPDILTAKECQQLLKIGKNSMLRYLKTAPAIRKQTPSQRKNWPGGSA